MATLTLRAAFFALAVTVMPEGSPAVAPPRNPAIDAKPGAFVLSSICRPNFTIDAASHKMGMGFLLRANAQSPLIFLFTAQHLFSLPAPDMPQHATGAECTPDRSRKTYRAGPALIIAGAHPMGPLPSLRDVAVFTVGGRAPGLSLASSEPRLGDPVWLLGIVSSGAEKAQLFHRARVVNVAPVFAYQFDDQSIGLDQTSGAAVVNANGEVVGLNVGYGRSPRGELFGVANTLETLKDIANQLRTRSPG